MIAKFSAKRLVFSSLFTSSILLFDNGPLAAKCPSPPPPAPRYSIGQVYAGMPFQPGEKSTYEVYYLGVKAGYGHLWVNSPVQHQGVWHRVFAANAYTGDWYKAVYVAKNKVQAYSRPDWAVSKFMLKQDQGKMFGDRIEQSKWLDFFQNNCVVTETIQKKGRQPSRENAYVQTGAMDTLGIVFWLRTRNYQIGKTERALVYSSKKNWWLEAHPISFQKVNIPVGTFDAVKLKLKTFIGKELQQKGEVYVWIATRSANRQLLEIRGDIAIGSVYMTLTKFVPGRPVAN